MSVATLIREGAKGDEVRDIQSRLQSLGFDPGPVDGVFGSRTTAAVVRLQQAKGLSADGIVGSQTVGALDAAPGSGAPAGQPSTLVQLGRTAETMFRLSVGECSAPGAPAEWGPVHDVHAPNSLHKLGRAFDCSGAPEDMDRFAAHITANFTSAVTHFIQDANGSISNGATVDPSFWGDETWAPTSTTSTLLSYSLAT